MSRALTVVLTNDALDIAGGENYALYVARGLRERGHRVIMAPQVGSALAAVARERGFDTREIPYAARGREFAAAKLMADSLRGDAVDIVHTNSNLDRTIGAFAAHQLGAACVASIHSCLSIQYNVTHWLRNRLLIHRFTPVGHSTARVMIGTDRIDATRIRVVHIGLPADDMVYDAAGRTRVRAELGVPDGAVLIGNLARLVAFKGHANLLSALPRVLARFPDTCCAIAGDGELRAELQGRIDALGLGGAVTLLGHRTDVADVLSACDIYVQPSLDFGGETFPVSILGALATGRPVVASDVGDVCYMILDGDDGLLTPPADIVALAEALSELIGDAARRAAMGARARALFLDRFTLETMTTNLESVYREALTCVRRGRRSNPDPR
jgi:glycosyltransferase involved in cell wall biosynthesis